MKLEVRSLSRLRIRTVLLKSKYWLFRPQELSCLGFSRLGGGSSEGQTLGLCEAAQINDSLWEFETAVWTEG
jgi:hypothetical protein